MFFSLYVSLFYYTLNPGRRATENFICVKSTAVPLHSHHFYGILKACRSGGRTEKFRPEAPARPESAGKRQVLKGRRTVLKIFTESLSADSKVTLSAYLHEPSDECINGNRRPAVLVFPGGAYKFLSEREGEPIAAHFFAEGYQAFVLRYSIGEGNSFDNALRDADNALRRIRSMAEEWHLHPQQIAVCGFSAGGHLAAASGVMGQERPNAIVLGYPCILASMSKDFPFPVPSLDDKVTAATPPAFLFHTADDETVPLDNPLRFAAALDKAKVPFELHIFPRGYHGLALADETTSNGYAGLVNPTVAQWLPLCFRWLKGLFVNFESTR